MKEKKSQFNQSGMLMNANLHRRYGGIIRLMRTTFNKLPNDQSIYEQWVKDRQATGLTKTSVGEWLNVMASPLRCVGDLHPSQITVNRTEGSNNVTIDFSGIAMNLLLRGYAEMNELPIDRVAGELVAHGVEVINSNELIYEEYLNQLAACDAPPEAHQIVIALSDFAATHSA